MVKFTGYNRPLKRKVEFEVEEVVKIPTSRGDKWHIRGTHDGKKMSAFTSRSKAEEISLQLKAPLTIYEMEEMVPNHIRVESGSFEAGEVPEDADVPVLTVEEVAELSDEDVDSYDLDPKYLKKDGTPDLRYKVAREWLAMAEDVPMAILESEGVQELQNSSVDGEYTPLHEIQDYEVRDLTHSSVVEGNNSLDSLKYTGSAEESFAAPDSPPSDICFREHIPPEIWTTLSAEDKGAYMSTRDETLLKCPKCSISKSKLRLDNNANSDCPSCVFSGDDFAPIWWAHNPPPSTRQILDNEAQLIPFMGASRVIPQEVYHSIMLYLPDTVYAHETEDGLSYNLSYHRQSEPLVSALIETHGLKPDEAFIVEAEEFESPYTSWLNEKAAENEVVIKAGWAEDLSNYRAEEFTRYDTEEFIGDGEKMTVSEYYGNLFDFNDSDEVYTTFNGDVVVIPSDGEYNSEDVDWEGKPYTGKINPNDPDLDPVKADRNKDGKLASWERALGNQVAKGMREGGYSADTFEAHDCYVCGAEGVETSAYGGENVCSSCTNWKYEADSIEIIDLPHGWCDKCGRPGFNTWVEKGKEMNLCKNCYIMHFYRAEDEDKKDENWEDVEWTDNKPVPEEIYEDIEWDGEGVAPPKATTVATIVGLGALAAYLAPQQIRDFFKNLSK